MSQHLRVRTETFFRLFTVVFPLVVDQSLINEKDTFIFRQVDREVIYDLLRVVWLKVQPNEKPPTQYTQVGIGIQCVINPQQSYCQRAENPQLWLTAYVCMTVWFMQPASHFPSSHCSSV